jgi:hypothetical protein
MSFSHRLTAVLLFSVCAWIFCTIISAAAASLQQLPSSSGRPH